MAGGRGVIEHFTYWFMQKMGYRRFYYEDAFIKDLHHKTWLYSPWDRKGNYRSTDIGYVYFCYGITK